MEIITAKNSEPCADTLGFLWQRALNQSDDDLRKTLLFAKTNRRDVLKAIRKVVQEKRGQSLWKRWTYETAAKDVVIVRDLLEKILCWLDLIQANTGLSPQDFSVDSQEAWRLIWSPFRFLLQKPVEDGQAFGEMVNDLAGALCLLVRYQVLEAERQSQAIGDTSNSDGAVMSVYHAVYNILAHYIRFNNNESSAGGAGDQVDTHQLREKLFQADLDARTAIGQQSHRTLYLRGTSPETVHEIGITDELMSSLHQWGVPALPEAVEDHSTPDIRRELLETEGFQSWWEASTSSILSLPSAESEAANICQTARKLLSSAPAGNWTPAPVAYIDCSNIFSALEILRHVVASLTLTKDGKCCDVLVTEWQIKQAACQQNGSTVDPLSLEDCLRIILELTCANPMSILLDGVQDVDAGKLAESLNELVDKSENAVKVLLVTEPNFKTEPLSGWQRSGPAFHIRNAKAQPSWNDLETHSTTSPPSVHNSGPTISDQQATLLEVIKTGDMASIISHVHNKPSVTDADPADALSTAVLYNHTDILTYLLSNAAANPPSASSSSDALSSALLTAALTNHIRCSRILLDRGTDRAAMHAALRAAAMRGHSGVIKQLMAYFNDKDAAAAAAEALPLAAQHGHASAVHELLDAAGGADVAALINDIIGDAVWLASAGGHKDVVELLLDRGGKRSLQPQNTHVGVVSMAHRRRESHWDSLLRCTSPGWLEERAKRRNWGCGIAIGEEDSGSEDGDGRDQVDEEKKEKKEESRQNRMAATQTEGILAAMVGGNLSSVEKLARRGGATSYYYTQRGRRRQLHALEAAAAAGSQAVVSLFLRQRELLDIQAEHIGLAFAAAAKNGHLQIVQQLLLEGGGLDISETAASDALKSAARNSHAQTVEFLLDYGAAHERTKEDVRIVLENATGECATLVLKFLQLDQKQHSEDRLNELRQEALRFSAKHGKALVLNSIVSSGVALEKSSFTKAMEQACRSGHTAAVLALINSEAGGKLLKLGDLKQCLLLAARGGHAEVAQRLLPHMNLKKATKVIRRCAVVAAGNDHLACTQVLMAALQEKDCKQAARWAFAAAAQNGHVGMVLFLLKRGADPNKKSITRAMKECISRFRPQGLLSQSELELEARLEEISRFTLHGLLSTSEYDAWKKSGEADTRAVICMLLDHGADANAKDGSGNSVLHTAVQNCPVEVVKWLIEHGADVKAAATGSDSVFVAAAGRELDSLAVMELLLQAGGQLKPSGKSSIHPVLAEALEFFNGDIGPYDYRSTCDDPDGRFELAGSIQYVLEQGPGALIRLTLQLLPAEKAVDSRYGLLLQMAAADANASLVELLLARGVDVNAAGFYYGTALQAAARHGHEAMVSLLLAAGADVNALQGRYHTPLRAAVVGGHTNIIRVLLSHGADVALAFDTERDSYSKEPAASALYLAVERGHLAATELLLNAEGGAQLHTDQQQHESRKPMLMVVTARNNVRMAELLVTSGASDVNVHGSKRDIVDKEASPLHMACAECHMDMVRALLRLGADVNAVVQGEWQPPVINAAIEYWETRSPLMTAISCLSSKQGGAAAVVHELLNAGADTNLPSGGEGRTPLCEAASEGDVEVVEMLVKAGAALSYNPLGEACARGHVGVVEYLLERVCGTEVEQSWCADGMGEAAENRMHKVVELMLEFVAADASTLVSACTAGLPSLVWMVLEAGVHVDAQDESGLTGLLAARNPAVVRMLLESGADARLKTRWGCGPLTEAFRDEFRQKLIWRRSPDASSSTEEIVRLLVENGGADVNEDEGPVGEAKTASPLQLAVYLGSEKTVALLLDHGADVNRQCGSLDAPLLLAVENDQAAIVQLLLQSGADSNCPRVSTDAPLHVALRNKSRPCVRLLLRHGAHPNARGAHHDTPLTLAIQTVGIQGLGHKEQETCLDVFLREASGVRLTESDLVAAAESTSYSANLRRLLDLFVKDIPVSEAVVVSFLKNLHGRMYSEEDRSLFRDLLGHANGIGITPAMVQKAHDFDTLDFLFTQCGQHHPVCAITPAVLEGCKSIVTIFYLLQRDKRLVPTQLAALNALRDVCHFFEIRRSAGCGCACLKSPWRTIPRVQVVRLLWERNLRLPVSLDMLVATLNGEEFAFLLARAKDNNNNNPRELFVDQDTIFEVVNKGRCTEKLRVLSEFFPDLRLENSTIARLIEQNRWSELDVWTALLRYQPQLVVTEEVFLKTSLTEEWVGLMREWRKRVVFTDEMRKHVEKRLASRSQAAFKESVFSLERSSGWGER